VGTLSLLHSAECVDGARLELGELVASARSTVRGIALQDGEPLAGWAVFLRSSAVSPSLWPAAAGDRRVLTAADGSFAFGGCAGEQGLFLFASEARAGAPLASATVRPGGPPVRLDARAPGATVRVRGCSASTLRVEVRGAELMEPLRLPIDGGEGDVRLPAGDYELVEQIRGLGERCVALPSLEPREVRVVELPAVATGALRLQLAPAPEIGDDELRLSFLLHGQGLNDRFDLSTPGRLARFDPIERTLFFPALLPGSYQLTISSDTLGGRSESLEVTAGEPSRREISLERGCRLRIVGQGSRALRPGETLIVKLTGPRPLERALHDSQFEPGTTSFPLPLNLPAGEYEVRFTSDQGCTARGASSCPALPRSRWR
jgi:hypothetical protein